ncbi:hypothetical protein [Bacillus cereus group sp. BfR-BA-01495]|uniref:hypothetical protein n=1 Tax=Bacillus cereus group sp. BfR-BA-01495 TaxID=2920363 RepID=UPI001F57A170|nr:hypothetical protein [Bacillus cereus group sp. BfR-BA-01495]
MKNLFNGFFKKGNETKLESLQGEQGKLQGQVSQLEAKQARVQNALQLAEVDHELEQSVATKKRVDKYVKAIEEATKEITSLQEQLNKLASDIASVNAEEEQLRIESLANEDVKHYESHSRGAKAKELMRRIEREVDNRTNYLGAGSPYKLINDTDFTNRGHGKYAPSNFQPYHQVEYPAHVEAWEKVTKEANEKIDAELAELIKAVNKYFGKELM